MSFVTNDYQHVEPPVTQAWVTAITISLLTKDIFLWNTYRFSHFEAFMRHIVFFFQRNALLKHDIMNLGPGTNSTDLRWAFNVLNLIYLSFLCVSFDQLAYLHEWSRTASHMRRTDMPFTPLDECTQDCCILVRTRDRMACGRRAAHDCYLGSWL